LSRRARNAWRLLLALLLAGCQADYGLPPTACDDYCRATQRGDCPDDAPADCVRDCEEADRADVAAACVAEWQSRNDCLLRTDASSFSCRDNHSQIPNVCLDERRALGECSSPGSGPCFDECRRQVETCDADWDACETGCRQPSAACQAASNTYSICLADYPVECRDFFMAETRAPEDIPCFYEALALLACR
jgi:hypothetical protein